MSGIISTIDKDCEKAKEFFLLAVDCGLGTDHMQSVTYCILADTSLRLNEAEEAKVFFEKAKKIPHRNEIQPIFEDLSKRIDEEA